MNRANQEVVNQSANITLISIRQAEISYFSSFFASFGTQCFLLAGFLAGSISQTPAFNCATNCVYFWQILYNVSVAICMGLTCLVLIATVFISVFGQGLAIRGPTGSMIQTVHGMIAEQHRIVLLFMVVVISFQSQFLAMFFIVMDRQWAVASGVCLGIIGYYTYYCSMRIYNRFKWDFSRSGWNYDINPDSVKSDHLDDLPAEVLTFLTKANGGKAVNRGKVQEIYVQAIEQGLLRPTDPLEKKKSILASILTGLNSTTKPANARSYKPFEDVAAGSSASPFRMMNEEDTLPAFGVDDGKSGYLTVKVAKTQRSSLGLNREKWIRYYFVLKGASLYYYEDRRHFEENAFQPINQRAIDLDGYSLITETPAAHFPFTLIPTASDDIRKTWRFRCDTMSEYQFWTTLLRRVIPAAAPNNNGEDEDD